MTRHQYAPNILERATDWRHNALCATQDPDLHHPTGNTGPALLQIEEAKAVCRRCPVMEHCLQWALTSGSEHGVWGGLDEDERRAMKRSSMKRRAARRKPNPNPDPDRLAHARDLADRHAAGASINALARATGHGWHEVRALVDEGQAAA